MKKLLFDTLVLGVCIPANGRLLARLFRQELLGLQARLLFGTWVEGEELLLCSQDTVLLVLHCLELMRTFLFFSSIVMVLVLGNWVMEEEGLDSRSEKADVWIDSCQRIWLGSKFGAWYYILLLSPAYEELNHTCPVDMLPDVQSRPKSYRQVYF